MVATHVRKLRKKKLSLIYVSYSCDLNFEISLFHAQEHTTCKITLCPENLWLVTILHWNVCFTEFEVSFLCIFGKNPLPIYILCPYVIHLKSSIYKKTFSPQLTHSVCIQLFDYNPTDDNKIVKKK